MLPLLLARQMHEADAHTMMNESISSIDLMERASRAFVGWIIKHYANKEQSISVYCGTGNNGGDGLAIARILHDHGYKNIRVIITRFSEKASEEFTINLQRLQKSNIPFTEITAADAMPEETGDIIIDAMLGSGINKPLTGNYKQLVEALNQLNKTVVAVDVPTGLYTDGEMPEDALVLKAQLVITFQQPKLNFLLPESGPHMQSWEAVKIGLDEKFIGSINSPYQLVEEPDIRSRLKARHKFSNKGTYGHALMVTGKSETMGAALLCAAACVNTGSGLTTACIPQSGLTALNCYAPEVMAVIREEGKMPDIAWDKYNSIGIGPGLGKNGNTLMLLTNTIAQYKKPMVIDADALNLLAEKPELLMKVPPGSILTPHMKEFDRLFGEHTSWWQRLQTAILKAKELNLYIVLKNDYTITATPEGRAYFNSTSNAAMATGGMGDVLTGIITSLLAQKYSPEDACILGMYIHGKAGDELALPNRMNVVLPQKIIAQLPVTMAKLIA